MTTEDPGSKLTRINVRIETAVGNIYRLTKELSAERLQLETSVREHGVHRVELVKREMAKRQMTWCTYCNEMKLLVEVELLLVDGNERVDGSDQTYGFRPLFKIHRACASCREGAADRHGWLGEFDTQARDQESFYAFRVEQRVDGFYARRFGQWVKLDDKRCQLDELTDTLIEKLASEWGLPLKVEFKWHQGRQNTLMIDGKPVNIV